MSISPLTTTGTEIKSSLYLPSVGFGFLFIYSSIGTLNSYIYLIGFVITLISAVMFHEFIESYSGPSTGLFENVPADRIYQSIGYTLYKTGEPKDYPKRPDIPPWEFEVDISPLRHLIAYISIGLFILLIISYPYTVYELGKYSVLNSSLLPGAIAFAEVVFVLRLIIGGMWPKTYLYWEMSEEGS